MPWTMKVELSERRMLTSRPPGDWRLATGDSSLDLRYSLARGLPHRGAAVTELDPVLAEDFCALFLPRARDSEDRDRFRRVLAQFEAGRDHAAGDDVHAGVGDDRHHHRDL